MRINMKFINILSDKIKNLDLQVVKLMKFGFIISFIMCLLSSSLLFTYQFIISLPILFYISISIFRSSLSFGVTFFICGIGFDTMKKQMI